MVLAYEGDAPLQRINDLSAAWYVEEETEDEVRAADKGSKAEILTVTQYIMKNGYYVTHVGQPFFFTFPAVCITFKQSTIPPKKFNFLKWFKNLCFCLILGNTV